jgi:hypothetical protein
MTANIAISPPIQIGILQPSSPKTWNFSRKGAMAGINLQTNWKKYLLFTSELGAFAPLREAYPVP